jgi:uncharacterized protein (TIGR00661 family)
MPSDRKRILYGVHGYGRGHAARALAMLPRLMDAYDVCVLAGDDAYDQLSAEYDVMRIPALRYYQGRKGRRSAYQTIKRSIPASLDLLWQGPISYMVEDAMRQFQPDVVISDSEGWTHRAARRLGIPRISFDHFGILVYCRLPMGPWDRFVCRCESICYKALVKKPDRIVTAAFFPGEPVRPGVRVVGPILRELVRQTQPSDGEHLLVYFTNAREHYTPAVEEALRGLDIPVKVYHPHKRGELDNIAYHPLGNEPFVRDLASCRAVLSTSGNQLISEAIYFGKPILTCPEEALEQRLNARFVSDWTIGMGVSQSQLTTEMLQRFLARTDEFKANIPAHQRDGIDEAWDALTEAIESLSVGREGGGC